MAGLSQYIIRVWYSKPHLITYLLSPFSYLFRLIIWLRRYCYRWHLFKSHRFTLPIIVVGNITVGGTGKTPLVIAIVEFLKKQGLKPAIVSRGYGGKKIFSPILVDKNTGFLEVGEEPILLSSHSQCPVAVAANRSAAVAYLLKEYPECDVIVSDDGLQHYALNRDVEIAVIDGQRRLGNGFCLPAGPLREPLARLQTVDFVVNNSVCLQSKRENTLGFCKGREVILPLDCSPELSSGERNLINYGCLAKREFLMTLQPLYFYSVNNYVPAVTGEAFEGKVIHAVAGIGNPSRFFQTLVALGVNFIPHTFPDHYIYESDDLNFDDNSLVIMTEKDAIKCQDFADNRYWYLKVEAVLEEEFTQRLINKLASIKKSKA